MAWGLGLGARGFRNTAWHAPMRPMRCLTLRRLMTDPPVDQEREDYSPHARDVLPVLPIVPFVAWLVQAGRSAPFLDWATWIVFVSGSAALIGLPALFWSLDHRRVRLHQLATVGAIGGAVPMLMGLASGAMGQAARIGWRHVGTMLASGAPIPIAGFMPWPAFVRCVIEGMVIGSVSGLAYRLLLRLR